MDETPLQQAAGVATACVSWLCYPRRTAYAAPAFWDEWESIKSNCLPLKWAVFTYCMWLSGSSPIICVQTLLNRMKRSPSLSRGGLPSLRMVRCPFNSMPCSCDKILKVAQPPGVHLGSSPDAYHALCPQPDLLSLGLQRGQNFSDAQLQCSW